MGQLKCCVENFVRRCAEEALLEERLQMEQRLTER
jgi:hypothetical protein